MTLKGSDIAQHNSAKSCWVIIHVSTHVAFNSNQRHEVDARLQGKAYDVTDFLPGNAIVYFQQLWSRSTNAPL